MQVNAFPARVLRSTCLPAPDQRSVLVVLHDLTDLRRAEAVRRTVLTNITHDLRTSLALLQLMIETLQDSALDDRRAATAFLGRMDTVVQHLSLLVTDALDLARLESASVEIAVRDTGSGSAAADLPHIFERFFKPDQSRQHGGARVGLSIVQAIVQHRERLQRNPRRHHLHGAASPQRRRRISLNYVLICNPQHRVNRRWPAVNGGLNGGA